MIIVYTIMEAKGSVKASHSSTCLSELCAKIDIMLEQLDSSEITITFKDQFMDQFQDTNEVIWLMRRYFASTPFNDIRELLLVPEYGNNMRLHFHGIIRGKKKDLCTLKTWLRKRFGFTTIQMIRLPLNYKKYLIKERPDEYIYITYERND